MHLRSMVFVPQTFRFSYQIARDPKNLLILKELRPLKALLQEQAPGPSWAELWVGS